MKRNEHTFQFTGKQIADAAKAECSYHRERLTYWQVQQETAITDAKTAGVTVQEIAVTGGKRVQMYADQRIQERLSIAGSKIDAHRVAADRFQIEAAAYATQADRAYELHPDDIVYFRLAGGQRED